MTSKFLRPVLFASLFVLLTTLAWQRNLKNSSISALLTLIATTGSLVLLEKNRQQSDLAAEASLQLNLENLRREQSQLQEYINEAFQLEQDVSASVRSLQSERLRLLNRISSLHGQRNHITAIVQQLKQDNKVHSQQRQDMEEQLNALQKKYRSLKDKVEAHAALDTLAPEMRLHRLQNQLLQVRRKLAEQQHQQKLLQTEFSIAHEQKIDLEGSIYDLRTAFKVLEQRYAELQENLETSNQQYQDISFSILGGKAAVNRLFNEILLKRQEKAALAAEIEGLQDLRPMLEENLVLELLPPAWQAWLRFVQHLTPEEQQFLKIILNQENLIPLPENLSVATKEPVETLEKMLHQQALLFLGESPFVRVGDRPLPQLKAEYHSLLSQSLLMPMPEGRFEPSK
ncbi:MAG: hypothetical protein HC799_17790 [Limnothrix sp. RL_2_0]|nr:hypothetical protein [Limnothrix sp. RL_2_0]